MNPKYPVLPSVPVNVQTGTTYTLKPSDNGTMITLNNGSAVTVTIPVGLAQGFNVILNQLGAGQVTISAASGVTMNNKDSHTKIEAQYGVVSLIATANNIFNLSGATAA